jgi:hypothetical protein
MRSLLKFLILLLLLIFSTAMVVPLLILVFDAVDDGENSLLFKMYKDI